MEPVEHLAPARSATKAENTTDQDIDAGEKDNGKQEEMHLHHLPIVQIIKRLYIINSLFNLSPPLVNP